MVSTKGGIPANRIQIAVGAEIENIQKQLCCYNGIIEQFIKPNLKNPAVTKERLILYQTIPRQVVNHVFDLAKIDKIPSIGELCDYVESIKHKAKPEIIYRSRSTVSRWLRKIKESLVKLGYVPTEGGKAFHHKIRDPHNDAIGNEKSQKGFGSSGKDYDQ